MKRTGVAVLALTWLGAPSARAQSTWEGAEEPPESAAESAPRAPEPAPASPPGPPAPPAAYPGYAPPPPGYPWYPPPGIVPLVIRGDRPGLRFSLSLEKTDRPFAYCPYDCTLQLQPGQYWLTVHGGDGIVEGKRRLEVEGPSQALVTPRTEEDKSSGRTMGFIGIGLLAGGVAMLLWSLSEAIESEDRAVPIFFIGLGAFATGAVLTPIGFVRGGRSAPLVEVNRLDAGGRR